MENSSNYQTHKTVYVKYLVFINARSKGKGPPVRNVCDTVYMIRNTEFICFLLFTEIVQKRIYQNVCVYRHHLVAVPKELVHLCVCCMFSASPQIHLKIIHKISSKPLQLGLCEYTG